MSSTSPIDIIIIGSGPAAYTASLYTHPYKTLIFEGEVVGSNGPGGQLTTTVAVDNFPGFPDGIEGPVLMKKLKADCLSKGHTKVLGETVSNLEKEGNLIKVESTRRTLYCKSVIVATGAQAKRLYIPGTHDGELWQRGISSCAICDGWVYGGRVVAVVGGGDSAMEECKYLSSIAKKVYLIHRSDIFRAKADLLQAVKKINNVEILPFTQLKKAVGDDLLEYIIIERSGKEEKLSIDGLFFAIGHIPNTSFLKGVKLKPNGYIESNKKMETNLKGVYCCGDVQDSTYRQAVTAAASGSVAGISVVEYLRNNKLT